MNRIYRSVWNATLGAWVAAPETARTKGRATCSERLDSSLVILKAQQERSAPKSCLTMVAAVVASMLAMNAVQAQQPIELNGDIRVIVDRSPIPYTLTQPTWVAEGELNIHDGEMRINAGGEVASKGALIAPGGPAENSTVVVKGAGATWSVDGSAFYVGYRGQGTLKILEGGRVNTRYTSFVAGAAGSQGSVLVSGTDGAGNASIWEAVYGVSVGSYGTAEFTVDNGGMVKSRAAYLGINRDAVGTVTIDKAQWHIEKVAGVAGQTGELSVANAGTGELIVKNQGVMTAVTGELGRSATGKGTIHIQDASLSLSENLIIGGGGLGEIYVEAGGTLSSGGATLGAKATAEGTVNLKGTDASWVNTGALTIGNLGKGTLNIDNETTMTNDGDVVLGLGKGGEGIVAIKTGGQWKGVQSLTVGGAGKGTLNILEGVVLATTGKAQLGLDNGGEGVVQLTDQKASWANTGVLNVGVAGNGYLKISNSASMTNTGGAVTLGVSQGGYGKVDLMDTGLWKGVQGLTVGLAGKADLNVSAGAQLTTIGSTLIAAEAGSQGTVQLTDAGSTWTNNGDLTVGGAGYGQINVDEGTTLENTGSLVLGSLAKGNGTVNVNKGILKIESKLSVGQGGKGTLNLAGTTFNSSDAVRIGVYGGGSGEVNLQGAGVTWEHSAGAFTVGAGGKGVINIEAGAVLSSSSAVTLGELTGGDGIVNVKGGEWKGVTDLVVGKAGAGVVNLQDVQFETSGDTVLGGSAGGSGAVNLLKVGATATPQWISTGKLTVGEVGQGRINVSAGTTVQAKDKVILGAQSGSLGKVVVSGATAVFSVAKDLTVGGGGEAILEISDRGLVVAESVGVGSGGVLSLLGSAASRGVLETSQITQNAVGAQLNLNGGVLRSTANSTDFLAGFVSAALGANGVVFDTNSHDIKVQTSLMSGVGGGLIKQGPGTLKLTGQSVYTGNTDVQEGDLLIADGGSVQNTLGLIAQEAGKTATVTVNGKDSSWLSTQGITVGGQGVGTLRIEDEGAVAVHTITLGEQSGSKGTLEVVNSTLEMVGISTQGDGDASLLLDGATLRSLADNSNFLGRVTTAELGAGGVTFDTNGYDVGVTTQLDGGSTSGGLEKKGAGILTLTGANAYTGGTTVLDGQLTVGSDSALGTGGAVVGGGAKNAILFVNQGVQATNSVKVDALGALTGFGQVGTTEVEAGGMLAPGLGTQIGKLTINGSLTLKSDSIHYVNTMPPLAGAGHLSDLVEVTGGATLNEGYLQHVGAPNTFAVGEIYTVLRADSINGKYGELESNFAYLNPEITYSSAPVNGKYEVYLGLVRNEKEFDELALTPNQKATAGGVASMDPKSDVYDYVQKLLKGKPPQAFDNLSGEIHAHVKAALAELGGRASTLGMRNLRANLAVDKNCAASKEESEQVTPDLLCPAQMPAWVEVTGGRQKTRGDGNAAEHKLKTHGIFVGLDEEVGVSGWRVGAALGYTRSDSKVNERNSVATLKNYSAAAYVGKGFLTQRGRFQVAGGASYSQHHIATDRTVQEMVSVSSVKADYKGRTMQLFGEVGYEVVGERNLRLEPFAGVNVARVHVDAFEEQGSTAALRSNSESQTRTSATFGLRVTNDVQIAGKDMQVRASFGWKRALGNMANTRTMQFAAGSSDFTIAAVPRARNTALLDVEAGISLSRNAVLEIGYSGEFGGKSRLNTAKAQLRWAF